MSSTPHGGRLLNLIASPDEAAALAAKAAELPSVTLSQRDLSDVEMLGIGAFSCALIMAPVLNLLNSAYGIGAPTAEHPTPLLAPQATLMASVAQGMFGGALPWNLVAIGVAIGIAIIRCARRWKCECNLRARRD